MGAIRCLKPLVVKKLMSSTQVRGHNTHFLSLSLKTFI